MKIIINILIPNERMNKKRKVGVVGEGGVNNDLKRDSNFNRKKVYDIFFFKFLIKMKTSKQTIFFFSLIFERVKVLPQRINSNPYKVEK